MSVNIEVNFLDSITLRLEREEDYRSVEELTRNAFWNYNTPGCDEHYCLKCIRGHEDFIPELDFVALYNNEIIGHIAYSKAKIATDDGRTINDIVTFGPISVSPSYQRKGIGRLLINHTRDLARKMGLRAIVIYGDPRYYGNVGFRCAEKYDIRDSSGKYLISLMAYELYPHALDDMKGALHISEAYNYDMAPFPEYDATFPPKEKIVGTQSQLDFKLICSMKYSSL